MVFLPIGEQMTKMVCCSFSKDGKNIFVGTKTHFILWNTSNGKLQKMMKEESSIKTMRNDWQLSVRDNSEVFIFSKFEKLLMKFNLPNIRMAQELLSITISPDMNFLYYANIKGIFRFRLNKNGEQFNEIVKFNEEETNRVIIDENCEAAMSTDMLTINIYKLNADNQDNAINKEKFTDITVNLQKGLLVVVDDLCVNITY